MPQRIETRSTTHRIGKGTHRRNNKEGQGCKERSRTKADTSKVVASSLFALRLKPLVGIEVMEKQSLIITSSSYGEEENFYKMYNDLLEVTHHAIYMITSDMNSFEFDPLKDGMHFSNAFTALLRHFEKKVLPEGFEYNIDKDKEGYYFTLYSFCEFENHWHPFEIKPIVEYLEDKGDEQLMELFFTVLHTFKQETDTWSWWGGGMSYAECMMDDYELENRYDLDDEDEYMEFANNSDLVLSYKSGYIYSISKKITNSPIDGAQSLMLELADFEQSDPIVEWMFKVLEFIMETPGNVRDYVYFQDEEDIEMGLNFMQMVTIIWDWDDIYTKYEMEAIDSEAQNVGVSDATYSFTVRKGFDIENYIKRDEKKQWPMHLHKLWDYHTDFIEVIKRKNDECKDKYVDEGL